MLALRLRDGALTLHTNWPKPEPGRDDALIRVTLSGVCSTDLELVKGYAGGFSGTLGHEFVGVVEETGSAADADWIGRRVVGGINLGCRRCEICLGDGPEHCPNRTTLGIHDRDGAFAQWVTLPVVNLLEVPAEVADEDAVFTEPLAAAVRVREQLHIRPTARIAVVGPGRLGLLSAQVLALGAGDVVVLGRRPETLELPARLGLRTGLTEDQPDNSFDLVVEATGNEAGLAHSLRLARPRGTLVLKSTFHGNADVNLTKLVVSELTVVGSRCGPFAPALRLLAANATAGERARAGLSVQVRPLIEAEYPLSDALAAFDHAARPGVRKVLIRNI